ncbi:MAG TPA: valine--tRNA ligase [Actinomycetota bacterium]|nr:valine--tRNA ligase [Actinomycetota bacterium]
MAEKMPTSYDPHAAEAHWYPEWTSRGYFGADPGSGSEPFTIVLPPPNVTGALHIGHALDQTIQDGLTRRRRMQGHEALWLPGTDHAGIATQVVVERELRKEGIDRRELGREAFLERVWEWKERYGGRIVEQMKGMGSSADWERLAFTMDEPRSRAVREAFVRMYEAGLIYRGERLVNWCPTDQTALSDSELEHEDVEGELVTFRYPLSDGNADVRVATTRLETMLGDTGIAVHPDDERYSGIVGKTVRHPFDGREIPVVADAAVDPSFGTGAVKVTPAHDQNDFDIAERTGLPLMNILNADATLNDQVPEAFRGMDRYDARKAVRDALEGLGLLLEEERPYVHAVAHCYRCHSEIEPWLSGKQWFVKVEPLVGPAKQAALDGRIRFYPERWLGPYTTWLDNLRDWNISRQLWWGHRIPVWYCSNGHEFAAREDPTACPECGSGELEQDADVLDTWFSSQLWPFATLGWPDDTEDLRTFYPTSVLVTGYEILYLWVARMIMSGLFLVGDVPFRHVVIHGLVRDRSGRKMSKSLGNVIDPLDMIERYGADALRFALARMSSPEQQNLPLSEEAIETGRNFANKIWNAGRFVLSSWDGVLELPSDDLLTVTDRWLLSRHESCRDEVDDAYEEYRFDDAAQALQRFLWSELADWGLEAAKRRLYEGSEEERVAAARVLAWVLERTLRLLHPIMPFVTEEVWQRFRAGDSVMVAPWPEGQPTHKDEGAERRFGFVQELVSAVRRFRSGNGLAPGVELSVRVVASEEQLAVLGEFSEEIRRMARVSSLEVAGPGTDVDAGGSARLMVEGAEVLIPLAGVLDPATECERLRKRIEGLGADAAKVRGKLSNDGFTSKAPSHVVEKERRKLDELDEELAALEGQLTELGC